jgi:hypothetical protein
MRKRLFQYIIVPVSERIIQNIITTRLCQIWFKAALKNNDTPKPLSVGPFMKIVESKNYLNE